MRLRSILGVIAKLGRPLLRLVGVKGGTVASKAAEAVEEIDKALPPEEVKP
jgi:hypothetical protein